MGPGYTTRIDDRRHIVYVSALDANTFNFVQGLLSAQYDAQLNGVFRHPLLHNIIVLLPTLEDYRKIPTPPKALGFYHAATHRLVSITVGEPLVHEFIHALHHNDQAVANQHHPVWLSEGFATLFQRSQIKDGQAVPDAGSWLADFQQAMREGKAYSLADLLKAPQDVFLTNADVAYSEVRYLMLYLYRTDKLQPFYDAYKQTYAQDDTGQVAMEKVLGKPLASIDVDYRQWVLQQTPAWRPADGYKAYLGVRMEPADQGVLASGFIKGSPAANAGQLREGDVIVALAGEPTPDAAALVKAVRRCEPGQTVVIEVFRAGRRISLTQVLGSTTR